MDKIALKNCPFCANDVCAEQDNVKKAFRIYCANCPAEMRVTYRDANLDDGSVISFHEAAEWMNALIEMWNGRV